jgi:hypothetical protein
MLSMTHRLSMDVEIAHLHVLPVAEPSLFPFKERGFLIGYPQSLNPPRMETLHVSAFPQVSRHFLWRYPQRVS